MSTRYLSLKLFVILLTIATTGCEKKEDNNVVEDIPVKAESAHENQKEIPSYESLDYSTISNMENLMSKSEIDSSDVFTGPDAQPFIPGTYLIYKTSQGRYGKMIVEQLEPSVNNRLTISWVTYRNARSIYTSGSGLVIRGTYSCDLDLGMIPTSPFADDSCTELEKDSDFYWQQKTKTTRALTPRNHALFKLVYRP